MKDLLLLQPPENRKERKSQPGYFMDESGRKIIYHDILVAVKPKIYHSVLGYKKKKKMFIYFLNLIHS